MPKRLLDIGNCSPDYVAVRRLVASHFRDVEIVQAHDANEALAKLKAARFDLVLVNRKLDRDYTDGIDVIKEIKADPDLRDVPVMLLTNYPQYQAQAVAAGAVQGFGKLEYHQPQTVEKLRQFLGD